jgi:hypothetical protein
MYNEHFKIFAVHLGRLSLERPKRECEDSIKMYLREMKDDATLSGTFPVAGFRINGSVWSLLALLPPTVSSTRELNSFWENDKSPKLNLVKNSSDLSSGMYCRVK